MTVDVHPDKILKYLLSPATVASEGKRKFFEDSGGYSMSEWWRLRHDLMQHPIIAQLVDIDQDQWGEKQIYKCFLPLTPNGKRYCVCTVWQEKSQGVLKFITAYPSAFPVSQPP